MAKEKKSDDDGNGNGNGNGGNGPTLFHPWDLDEETAEGRTLPEPEAMDEYHLDHRGKKRLFRLRNYERGSGSFLEAMEVRKSEPTGWTFRLHYNSDVQMAPYYEMRTRLRERLATRDLVRDPDTGELSNLTNTIRAQVSSGQDPRRGPPLLVDGELITWRELGQLLRAYEGWGLRIQITDTGEE